MENTNFLQGFEKAAVSKDYLFDKIEKALSSRMKKVYVPKSMRRGTTTNYELASKTNDQMNRIRDLLKKRKDIGEALAKRGRNIDHDAAVTQNKMFNLWKSQMTVRSSAKTLKKKTSFKDQADGKY